MVTVIMEALRFASAATTCVSNALAPTSADSGLHGVRPQPVKGPAEQSRRAHMERQVRRGGDHLLPHVPALTTSRASSIALAFKGCGFRSVRLRCDSRLRKRRTWSRYSPAAWTRP